MITLHHAWLEFRFPEIHAEARCRIRFQRTFRVPDDNQSYPLPPGIDTYPLLHVDDYVAKLPEAWHEHGGVFFSMYQGEAMWIDFDTEYPFAIKIAAGKVNAVTGAAWDNELHTKPQDYAVIPHQPWLDGFCVGNGVIRQFVAMPLGEGFSAEEQLTGMAEHGGIQIVVYPLKRELYEVLLAEKRESAGIQMCINPDAMQQEYGMGLAPGGLIRQQVYDDYFGIDAWETTARSRCFVHILNSAQYRYVTGKASLSVPYTAENYTNAGLPWFDYYDETKAAVQGASKLAGLDSVAAKMIKNGKGVMSDNSSVNPDNVVDLTKQSGNVVREGKF
jgi:hypothetical protein